MTTIKRISGQSVEELNFKHMTKKELTIQIVSIDDCIEEAEVDQESPEFKAWMNLTKVNLIEELEDLIKDNNTKPELKPNIKPQTEEKEKNNMPEMKENFVILSNDARLQMASLKKATEAVAAVKAVKEKKDKEGNVTQEAVAAVKAKPATPAVQKVFLIAKNEDVCNEILARMADQGFTAELDGQPEILEDKTLRLAYKAETAAPIRAAFKACKAKDGYNAGGMAIIDAQRKEEAKIKKKAAQDKAKAAEKNAKPKDEARGNVEPTKEVEEGGDEWPGSFDE